MLAASPSRAANASSAAPSAQRRWFTKLRSFAPILNGKAGSQRSGLDAAAVAQDRDARAGESSKDLNAIVEKAARAHNVDPLLVHSVIKVESNYNANAVSNKGAQGLMQLTPSTARMLGVSNSFDPAQNIEAGVKYLKYLKDLYKDDRLALAAYNAGPGAVDKYKRIPPYAETQNYVYQVGKRYGEARARGRCREARGSPAAEVSRRSEARRNQAGGGGAVHRREWQAASQDSAVGRELAASFLLALGGVFCRASPKNSAKQSQLSPVLVAGRTDARRRSMSRRNLSFARNG